MVFPAVSICRPADHYRVGGRLHGCRAYTRADASAVAHHRAERYTGSADRHPEPTPTATAEPKPAGAAAPAPTKAAAIPPLADAVKRVRTAVEALGGALDRLYHGGGGEACGPLLANLSAIVGAPDYAMTNQPDNVQNAYGLYQAAIGLMADKMRPIAQVCLSGGGTVGKLDFDMARTAINQVGSWLTQALAALGQ